MILCDNGSYARSGGNTSRMSKANKICIEFDSYHAYTIVPITIQQSYMHDHEMIKVVNDAMKCDGLYQTFDNATPFG